MSGGSGQALPRYPRGSRGQEADPGVARDLTRLARQLRVESSVEAVLERIVHAAVAEIGSAEYAGITEVDARRRLHTRVASNQVILQLEQLQYQLGEGPCLTSAREEVTVRCDELISETRWPRFAAAAVELGVQSMLSLQLYVDHDNLGALNLYARVPGAFTEADESTAMLLATHAALAMQRSTNEDNFRTALASRDVIGQAKGILMERYKIDAVEAFHLLVMASQGMHCKLRDLADELARTGQFDFGAK